jgi:hypothetical protein
MCAGRSGLGAIITIASVFCTIFPVWVWLQIDPVIRLQRHLHFLRRASGPDRADQQLLHPARPDPGRSGWRRRITGWPIMTS